MDLGTYRRHLEANANRGDLFAKLLEQDEVLMRRGFPPISGWWREVLKRFYRQRAPSGVYRLVARAGRRGGKSTTMDRVAVVEGLHGPWKIPPGDVGQFHFFSVKLGYAVARLDSVCAILDALGARYTRGTDRIGPFVRLEGRPVEWRATAANFRTAVSFTCIGAIFDELARWRDEKTGKNPATHVLQSVRPAMLTQLRYGAKEFMISSPWADLDAHYEAFQRGETEQQSVAVAESWVANPTVTESDCRRLADEAAEAGETEAADFDREYRAIPMRGGPATFFDHDAIEAAVRMGLYVPIPGDILVAGGDFGFARNSSALYLGAWTPMGGEDATTDIVDIASRRIHRPVFTNELQPPKGQPLRPSETVSTFARDLQRYGVRGVMADQHYRESIDEHLNEHGLGFMDAPLSPSGSYVRAAALLKQGRIWLPKQERFLRDLKEVESRANDGGHISIRLPKRADGSHADLVAAWVLSVWQRGGKIVEAPRVLQSGWTQQEQDWMEQHEKRDKGPTDDNWTSDGEWLSDG